MLNAHVAFWKQQQLGFASEFVFNVGFKCMSLAFISQLVEFVFICNVAHFLASNILHTVLCADYANVVFAVK